MMKKKLKDVTLKELKRFCRGIEECVANCPLFGCSMYPPGTIEPDVLEQEIEVPEEAE